MQYKTFRRICTALIIGLVLCLEVKAQNIPVYGNLVPSDSGAIDLGSPSLHWDTIFVNNIIPAVGAAGNYSPWDTTATDIIQKDTTLNVGIGTTTPEAKLHVSMSDTTGFELMHLENLTDNAIINLHSHADSSILYSMQTGAHSAALALTGVTGEVVLTNGLGVNAIEIDTTGITNILQNLSVSNGTTSQGKLYLVEDQDNGTNSVTIKTPASLASSYDFTLPPDDGSASQVLTTNGSGVTSWTNKESVWDSLSGIGIQWQSDSLDGLNIYRTSDGSYSIAPSDPTLSLVLSTLNQNARIRLEEAGGEGVIYLETGTTALTMNSTDINVSKHFLPQDSAIQNLGSATKRWGDGLINSLTTYSIIDEGSTVNTTAGDTATINAISGRFRKDATGAAFTLTNAYITSNSIIVLTAANAAIDVTALTFTVSAGSGLAVINFNAAPTANFDMNFFIIN